MAKKLTTSIVIPAYNEEAHLKACLEAIAAQTTPPLEVVVVDNNSTDRTAAIARSYSFVRVVTEARQGVVFARNAGFDAAKGDIIGRTDADIVLPSNWVEHLQQFYADPKRNTQAWTGCGVFYNVGFKRLVSWVYSLFAFRLNRLLVGHYNLWGSNMAILPQQWQKVRSSLHLRTDIHEDLDLALHLHQAGYDITYDRDMKVAARLGYVLANRAELWGYLQWWPRTLKIHYKRAWPICWLFGALLLYVAVYLLVAREWIGARLGQQAGREMTFLPQRKPR